MYGAKRMVRSKISMAVGLVLILMAEAYIISLYAIAKRIKICTFDKCKMTDAMHIILCCMHLSIKFIHANLYIELM
jgi:hypothetical protein